MNLMRHAGLDEKAMELSKPLTPLADRRYEGRVAPVALFMVRGLCPIPKCVLKEGHPGTCWPN